MSDGTSLSPSSKAQQKTFRAKVTLSRPSYRLGTSVVGTIRIRPNHRSGADLSAASLRDKVKNAVVYVAGFCRVDSRWHDVSNYSKMYGPFHPQLAELYGIFDPKLLSQGADTVCFWATNGLQLLELPERKEGHWNPCVEDDGEEKEVVQQQQEHLTFTFRVDIPLDIPPSISANTCRYFYSAEVLIRTNSDEQDVIKAPFSVLADPNQQPPKSAIRNQVSAGVKTHHVSSGRVKFGTCTGMAHSIGLPCHISATEIHRPRGQMTVQPSQLLSIRGGRPESLQTLRVNNSQDRPVCVLTLVGATKLTPGSRIHIKWDFPSIATMASSSSGAGGEQWLPCHQVSAALMGEELAIYEDGTTKRTRSFVFDTCHELVEAGGGTDRICKTLLLPYDAPCTICTDIMEISISCQIDITVEEVTGKYTNLKLEIPCHVVQNMDEDMDDLEQGDLVVSKSVKELVYGSRYVKKNSIRQEQEFKMADILQDLKILALQMEQASYQEEREKDEEEKEDYKLRIV